MKSIYLIAFLAMIGVCALAQPLSPDGLSASGLSPTSVLLVWSDRSADETGFEIERSISASSGFALIATAGANTTSFISTGLTAGSQYFYRIRAISSSGQSAYTSVVTLTTGVRRFLVDFGSTTFPTTATGWNNITVPTTGSVTNLLESGGGSTAVSLQIVNDPSDGYSNSTTSGYKSTLLDYPMTACQDGHFGYATGGTYRINGLNNTMQYNLRFFGSRIGVTDSRKSVFTINGQSQVLETVGNTSQTVLFTQIVPVNGSITIDFTVGAGSDFAYINVLDVVEYQSTPAMPTAFTATPTSFNQINLSWQDASGNETGFELQRSTMPGAGFITLTTLPANTTTYGDVGLTTHTTYYYRIRAVNASGVSAFSAEVNATTLPVPPAAPTTLAATADNQQINLTWIDASDNETGFQVERSLTAGSGYSLLTTVAANTSLFTDVGLSGNTAYYYRIRAVNAGGNSGYTNEATATTAPAPPQAPSQLSSTILSASAIQLTWSDNSVNETGFQVEQALVGGDFVVIANTPVNTTLYSVAGLSANTSYKFRVRANNEAGASAYSNEITATTLPLPPATPDALLATTASATQINLTWVDLSDNENGFYVERSQLAASGFVVIATVPPNGTTFQNTGLNPETTYFYQVRSFNTGGTSDYTPVVNATTLAAPPSAPTAFAAQAVSTSQINLTWNDASTNETGFEIERSNTAGSGYARIATTAANATSYADAGLAVATTYFYRIRSINAVGNSSYSNEVSAATFSLVQPYGEIFNETSFASATRFPIVGTGITRGTNKLVLNGAPGFFKSYVLHDDPASPFRYTCLENWTMRVRVKTPTSFTSSSYGISLGVLSTNSYNPYSSLMRWSWSPGNFKVHLYHKTTTSKQIVSTTSYTPVVNTFYWIEIVRNKDSFTYSVFDGATGTSLLYTVTLTFPTFTPATYVNAHNTGRFTIQQFGGNNTEITHWQVSTSAIKNADFIGVGDSNMHGMFATNNNQRWVPSAMVTAGKSFNILAGTADRAVDVLQRLPEIIALKPKAIVLSVGRNDLVNAIPTATVQANISTIINTLESAGITVYLAGVIASNTNVSSLQTFYNGRNNIKVNSFAATKSATANSLATAYNSGDNIHLNPSGNTLLSNLLLTVVNAPVLVSPTALSATTTSPTQIDLNWVDNATTETGYLIERSLTPTTGFTALTTLAANATQFTDIGLTPSVNYFYRVRAITLAGNSGYTNEAAAQTGSDSNGRRVTSQAQAETIELVAEPQLEVYPNPASQRVTIKVVAQPQTITLAVFDLLGRQLHLQAATPQTEYEIDLANIPAGVLVIKAQVGGKVLSKVLRKVE